MLLLLIVITLRASAQNASKPWAVYSKGILTFTFGAKPTKPSQTSCSGCGKKISNTANYCSNCGTKNIIDFEVFQVPLDGDWGDHNPWGNVIQKVEKVVFDVSFKRVTNIKSLQNWFGPDFHGNKRPKRLTSIVGIENLNTTNVTSMSYMFKGCENLSSIDLSHFNTSKVTDMCNMFNNCKKSFYP